MRWLRSWPSRSAFVLVLLVSLASAASAAPRNRARVTLTVSVLSTVSSGHAILRIGAATLLQYGLLSGEPVTVTIGKASFLAHVAFKDQIERAASYYASINEPEPFEPGVRLVLDRLDPNAQAELDTRTGGAEMPLETQVGQVITLEFVPAGPGPRAFPR